MSRGGSRRASPCRAMSDVVKCGADGLTPLDETEWRPLRNLVTGANETHVVGESLWVGSEAVHQQPCEQLGRLRRLDVCPSAAEAVCRSGHCFRSTCVCCAAGETTELGRSTPPCPKQGRILSPQRLPHAAQSAEWDSERLQETPSHSRLLKSLGQQMGRRRCLATSGTVKTRMYPRIGSSSRNLADSKQSSDVVLSLQVRRRGYGHAFLPLQKADRPESTSWARSQKRAFFPPSQSLRACRHISPPHRGGLRPKNCQNGGGTVSPTAWPCARRAPHLFRSTPVEVASQHCHIRVAGELQAFNFLFLTLTLTVPER